MYRILIAIILMLPTFSHAINYLGFGGGNYVYAEQGNLYFNLDPYVFDNRSWTYDETQGFSSEIKIKMDLKTKYTSGGDSWIQEVFANKKSDGLMYANYIKQPFNYTDKGHYQKVVWPLWVAEGAVTVGGFVARQFAWNQFKKHLAVGGAIGAAKYMCDLLAGDSIGCSANGVFTKTYEYAYVASKNFNSSDILVKDIRLTADEFANDAAMVQKVQDNVARTSLVYGSTYGTLKTCSRGSGSHSNYVSCGYADPNNKIYNRSINFQKEAKTLEEMVSDPELLPYFDKTCKLFPSECVNEPTQGKNIKDVQLTGGVVGSPVNVIGPPYTNPITGTSHQDQVIIGGSSSGIGVNSATNDSWEYSPTLGQSGLLNPTQVTSIPRPDLTNTDTAPVAKPNEQTGTKPQVVVPPVTVPEFTDLNDMIDFCKANPKAMSCIETGTGEEAESIFDKIKIPEVNLPTEFSKDNFLPATAACPAPTSIVTSHGTIMYSYDKHCEIAAFLRPIILIMATITDLFIIIRSKD